MHLSEGSNIELDGVTLSMNKAVNGSGIFVNESTVSSVLVPSVAGTPLMFAENIASFAGGGVYVLGASSVVQEMKINDSYASVGGGLYIAKASSMTIADLYIASNYASNDGGGMVLEDSFVTADGITVSSNVAGDGGGGMSVMNSKISGSVEVVSNTAQTGGGILSAKLSELNGLQISENTATSAGGGVAVTSGTLSLNQIVITNCSAPTGWGGGLFALSAQVIYNDLLIESCNSTRGGGVYVNSSTLAGITQDGVTGTRQATISAASASVGGGLFISGDGAKVSDMVISGGNAENGGGLATVSARGCIISRSVIVNSSATTNGGGAYFKTSEDCELRNLYFYGNEADDSGGGIAIVDSLLTHSNFIVSQNSAKFGGGIFLDSEGGESTIMQVDGSDSSRSTIDSNSISSSLGGSNICIKSVVSSTVSGMVVTGATLLSGAGGGAYITGEGMAVIENSLFENNYAQQGGAIAVSDVANLTLNSVGILGNKAEYGGGIWSMSPTLSPWINVQDSVFYNNTAGIAGGALYIEGATLEANRIIVAENSAGTSEVGKGGGLYVDQKANGIIQGSLFACNCAFYGGSLALEGESSLTIAKSNVWGETKAISSASDTLFKSVIGKSYVPWQALSSAEVTSKFGGLMYLVGEGTAAETISSTFAQGSAESGGGAYVAMNAYLQVEASIFEANSATESGGGIFLSTEAQAYIVDSTIKFSSK